MQWYEGNKRFMPWRQTRDPYSIWVSEIILQQTRVDQGWSYYLNFIAAFPDVKSLAAAPEEAVLSVWKGLGYYSRARNMHHTARVVMERFNGKFPATYDDLIGLKGIGPYTAAAIASICNDEAIPVVDGNVIRVFSRIFGFKEAVGSSTGYRKVFEKSAGFIKHSNPGIYNQAVMEFGALQCKSRQPLCDQCLFQKDCYAYTHNLVEQLPQPAKVVARKERFFHYFLITHPEKGILMQKRGAGDIWQNLWELPVVESDKLMEINEAIELSGLPIDKSLTRQFSFTDHKHVLTHQLIRARFFVLPKAKLMSNPVPPLKWQNDPVNNGLPMPRLIDKYLKNI
jgi:A/G-specific adenine glycosylase